MKIHMIKTKYLILVTVAYPMLSLRPAPLSLQVLKETVKTH